MKHIQLPSTKDILKNYFLNIQEKRNAFSIYLRQSKKGAEKKFSESITKRVTFDLKSFQSIPNYDDERGSEGINKKFPCFLYLKNKTNKRIENKTNIQLLSVWISPFKSVKKKTIKNSYENRQIYKLEL